MEFYLGEPYGDEKDGESQIRTREVLDTVESLMPGLVRIFMDAENAVEFDATGAEDEEQAQQESDVVSHIVWKKNPGFLNAYTFCKDALLSKTGILKVSYEDDEKEEREEYENLDDMELVMLFQDPERSEEDVVEHEQNEDGTHNITITSVRDKGQVVITACPPEELGVNRDSRSPNIQDCNFVYHRAKKTKAQLIEMGYDRHTVEKLPTHDDVETEERLARRNLDDEQEGLHYASHWSMHRIWITECYVYLDKNADGIAELLKVTLAAGSHDTSHGSTLLGIDEVDYLPFVSATPVILTHKFYGLSIADLVMDIQRIKSTLVRGILNNMYLANNQRTGINEAVNIDDILSSRPGGIVRTEGRDAPGNHIFPIPAQPVPQQVYDLLGYLDEERKDRTGVSDGILSMDGTALSNVNTGVAAMAYDEVRMRMELIAKIIGELGFRPLYKMVHRLVSTKVNKPMTMKLRNQWVEVDPTRWRERYDMTVKVGLGVTSRERTLTSLSDVRERQALMVQGGGMGVLITPEHIYNAESDYAKEMGVKDPDRYFMNPAEAPPPQPEEEDSAADDAMMLQAQATMLMAQAQQEKNQVEMQKIQSNERIKSAEIDLKNRQLATEAQISEIESTLGILKAQTDQESEGTKGLIASLEQRQDEAKLQLEQYKAELSSWTTLRVAGISAESKNVEQSRSEVEASE